MTESAIVATPESAEGRLRLLVLGARRLRDAALYHQARSILNEALELAEKAFLPDSFEVAGVLNQIGMLSKYSGQFDKAEAAYRRSLSVVAGCDCSLAADLYHNLGGLEHARGDFAAGELYARRAVEIRERLLGSSHADTAADMAALAALIDGQSRHAEAERLYRFALSVFERYQRHYDIAVTMNNLAALCQATGRADEAEELYQRCLALKETLLGAGHPDVASSINNLAMFRKSQGRTTEAAELFAKAISTFERTLDPTHPKLLACRKNYERLLRRMKENRKSTSGGQTESRQRNIGRCTSTFTRH